MEARIMLYGHDCLVREVDRGPARFFVVTSDYPGVPPVEITARAILTDDCGIAHVFEALNVATEERFHSGDWYSALKVAGRWLTAYIPSEGNQSSVAKP